MDTKALTLAALAVILLSAQYIGARTVLAESSVLAAQAWRGLAAGLVLLGVFYNRVTLKASIMGWVWLISAIILGYLLSQLLAVHGRSETPAEWRSVIAMSLPIMVWTLGLILRTETWQPMKLAGLLVAMVAVVHPSILELDFTDVLATGPGFYLATVAMVAASYFLLQKSADAMGAETTAVLYLLGGGALFAVLTMDQFSLIYNNAMSSAPDLLYLLFDLFIATAVGYWLFIRSLQKIGAVAMGALFFLKPLVIYVFEWIWWGDTPEQSFYVAVIGVAAGLVVFFKA